MRKGKIIKNLKEKYEVKTKYFKDYDLEVSNKSKTYYIKVLNVSNNHQITVNSKLIWNIKKGKLDGIKFNTLDSILLSLKEFNKLDNKIIMFTNKPYKLLKALNESDLIDISEETEINDIFVTYNISKLVEYMK
ncbi:MAG: hypothetical protein KQ78_01506 [Candidatus Izimaplasma bacterium HR2]|nr:MAG: hypothetical protein KQ78_01506 [Candidatus Izimaplasma bacterium HR2]